MVFGQASRWRTIRRYILIASVCFAIAGGVAFWKALQDYQNLPPLTQVEDLPVSTVVLDRKDKLLRAFISRDEKWRLPVELSDIDPLYIKMLLAFEDKRFRDHSGVDVRALARAALQSVKAGRIVSGGSTLTMQVARLLEEAPTKTLARKYEQILKAVQLEAAVSKDDILRLYILRAPFGGNLEGVRAASLTWFGKEPKRLTPAEAALLVALPQSPEARRPDRFPKKARLARNRVLARAISAGVLPEEEAESAASEPVRTKRYTMPFHAAHESRHARLAELGKTVHRLTLDRVLQSKLEDVTRRRISSHPAPVSMAMIVADHQSGEILASLGSPDLLDAARQGHVDMTRAIRSPGSTLKPFIYGLAFEEGIGLPESLIVDRPTDIGGYKPTNFDMAYQGTVTLREALQLSLNTPAVQLLEAVGPARLIARLKRAGVRPVLNARVAPGLAVGLGGLGLSLRDLVSAYAALANKGSSTDLGICRHECSSNPPSTRSELPVLSFKATWQIGDVLSGLPQSRKAGDTPIAYKTGTAYGYRDAWAIGFDGKYVVGVWFGRPDGSPVPGQTGASVAVPILFEAFQKLGVDRIPLPKAPDGLETQTAGVSATLPEPLRYARVENRPSMNGHAKQLQITYPPEGAEILMENESVAEATPLIIKVEGGQRPYRLLVNGSPVSRRHQTKQLQWKDPEPGFADLMVLDAKGNSSRVAVSLKDMESR
ncbi:MAG: penicillin-binding protein 1C [Roseibium sp.]